jgi:hypothetical protein
VDPITFSYPELTPYQFSSNSPIQGIDIDGLELFPTIFAPRLIFPRLTLPRIAIPQVAAPKFGPLGPVVMPKPVPLPPAGSTWHPEQIVFKPGIIETPDFEITYYNPATKAAQSEVKPSGQWNPDGYTGGYRPKKSTNDKNSGKNKDDIPSDYKGQHPRVGENGKEFAERLIRYKYGKDCEIEKGPGSDFNKLKKFGDNDFKGIFFVPVKEFIQLKDSYEEYQEDLEDYYDNLRIYMKMKIQQEIESGEIFNVETEV